MRSISSETEILNNQLSLIKAERSRIEELDSQLKGIALFLAQFEGSLLYNNIFFMH